MKTRRNRGVKRLAPGSSRRSDESAQVQALAEPGCFVSLLSSDQTGRWIAGGGRTYGRGGRLHDEPGAVALWDARSGDLVNMKATVGKEAVCATAFSPDASLLAVACWFDAHAYLLKVPSLAPVRRLPLIPNDAAPTRYGIVREDTVVESFAFSPDGARLAAGCWDLTAKLWVVARGTLQELSPNHPDNVDFVGFINQGKTLVSATADVIRLWDARRGRLLKQIKIRNAAHVWSHAMSHDGRRLVSLAETGAMRVWDTKTWKYTQFATGIKQRNTPFAISPDGRHVAVGRTDRRVTILDLETAEPRGAVRAPLTVGSIVYANGGASLACVCGGEDKLSQVILKVPQEQ